MGDLPAVLRFGRFKPSHVYMKNFAKTDKFHTEPAFACFSQPDISLSGSNLTTTPR